MPITPTILAEIRAAHVQAAQRGHAERTINAVRRANQALNGQVMRVRGGQGKRVAEVWSTDRHAYGKPGVVGAVGMSANSHVCRNLKTNRRKPTPTQRWTPPVPPEARAIAIRLTKQGRERRVPREMGTGAYDPRVVAGAVGVRREAGTRVVEATVVVATRRIVIGGRVVEVVA